MKGVSRGGDWFPKDEGNQGEAGEKREKGTCCTRIGPLPCIAQSERDAGADGKGEADSRDWRTCERAFFREGRTAFTERRRFSAWMDVR